MSVAVLTIVGFVGFAYFGYPALLATAAAVFGRRTPAPVTDERLPRVAVFVPAHNEEAVIAEKVRNLLALDYPKDRLTAVIVSDGSTDGTRCEVERVVASLPEAERGRVRFLEQTRGGKAKALSWAIPQFDVDVVVLTDANTRYEPDAVRRLAVHFADDGVGLVCGRLRYVQPDGRVNDEGLYWRYENALKRWEGRLGALLVSNGSIYAFRRRLFQPLDGAVADDLAMPQIVASHGLACVYEDDAVAFEYLPAHPQEDFRAKVRIITQGWRGAVQYAGPILRAGPARALQFFAHKVMRWVAPVLLLLLLPLSAIADDVGSRVVLLGQLGFYSLAAIGWALGSTARNPVLFRVPFYFCLVNLAALGGLLQFLFGRSYATWDKSMSTRVAGS